MGCGNGAKEIYIPPVKTSYFDDYPDTSISTFIIIYYQLIWKHRPNICIFQKNDEEIMEKANAGTLSILFQNMIIDKSGSLKNLLKTNHVLFYIHCTNGVIITRNSFKINYYLSKYMDSIINLCFVDISVIFLPETEYFSLYEIKKQSKLFFELENKEIDLTKRNELTNKGKLEELSDEEMEKTEPNEENNKLIEIHMNINKFKSDFDNQQVDDNNNENEKKIENEKIEYSKLIKNKILNKDRIVIKSINIDQIQKNNKNNISNTGLNSKSMINSNSTTLRNNSKNRITQKKSNNDLINQLLEKNKNKITIKPYKSKNTIKIATINKNPKASSLKNLLNKNNDISKENINNKIIDKSTDRDAATIDSINDSKFLKSRPKKMISALNIKSEKENKLLGDLPSKEELKFKRISVMNSSNIKKDEILDNSVNEEKETPPFIIKDNILIISAKQLNQDINKELRNILFENIGEDSPYDHIEFFIEEKKKIKKKNKFSITNIVKKEISEEEKKNDYIIINNKNHTPYEKRKSLNKIKKIIFTNCTFGIDSIFYIKEFVDMLTIYDKLIKIEIQKNNIDMNFTGWKFYKKLFRENFNIRSVNLENSLNDKVFEIMISAMLCKRIRYLNISNNKMTNKTMYHLNKFLVKNQTLTILDMSSNPNIDVEGIKFVLNALKLHPNIKILNLSNINLLNSGEYIYGLINENKSLKTLKLRDVKINLKDIQFISKELSKIVTCILHFDISLNPQIGNEGLIEIGKIINNNKTLKSIGLDGMDLTMINYLPVFKAIYKNRNIESYSLNMNEGLPLKGILNFFLKNPQVKEISIIPWDIEKEKKEFTEEQIHSLEKFHMKAPGVELKGIKFIEDENNDDK